MKVSVTAKHIKEGLLNFNSLKCPIGLALQDSGIKGIQHFDYNMVQISKSKKCETCGHGESSTRFVYFPENVRKFLITLRDNKKAPVEPFTFELDLEN